MQNQLAIRVQLKKPEAKKPVEDHLEIYWGRILGAGLLVTVLAASTYWGWEFYNRGPGPQNGRMAAAGSVGPESPIAAEATAVATPVVVEAVETSRPLPFGEANAATMPGIVQGEREAAVDAEAGRIALIADEPAAAVPTTTEVGRVATVTRGGVNAGAAQASVALAKVDVLSKHVRSAVFTDSREGAAPGQPLASRVRMAGRSLITLYLFTQYEGLEGQWVFHDWYLNGEQVARVRARPHQSPMAVHSSKYIDRYMTGHWEVRVRTESGESLATAAVDVVP